MNIFLLIFFALPIATIILSIVLQKILKCPLLVAITFFAIYLIVSFALVPTAQLVYALILTIIYSIIAYITAWLVKLACRLRRLFGNDCGCVCENSCNCRCNCNDQDSDNDTNNNRNNLLTISSNCGNGNTNDLLTISSNCSRNDNDNDEDNEGCNCSSNSGNVVLSANVAPNSTNNGRTGSFRGCYRRRF